MSESDIDRLADGATEGLRDDRELRLDVRQELVSHIEESIADCREGGMGQEQSVAEGVKAFGPAIEIAAELVSANRARMRVRQRVRQRPLGGAVRRQDARQRRAGVRGGWVSPRGHVSRGQGP